MNRVQEGGSWSEPQGHICPASVGQRCTHRGPLALLHRSKGCEGSLRDLHALGAGSQSLWGSWCVVAPVLFPALSLSWHLCETVVSQFREQKKSPIISFFGRKALLLVAGSLRLWSGMLSCAWGKMSSLPATPGLGSHPPTAPVPGNPPFFPRQQGLTRASFPHPDLGGTAHLDLVAATAGGEEAARSGGELWPAASHACSAAARDLKRAALTAPTRRAL